jgi:Leucine-rich repeat (LRR) protein
MKDLLIMDENEMYAEAQRRIKECRIKKGKMLDFSCLHLTKIPPEIAELETLTELNLKDVDIKEIPDFIGKITSLKKLSVGSDHGGKYKKDEIVLPPQLANLHNLENLSLGYGTPVIPQWVYGMQNLKALSIHSEFAETIPAEIVNLKNLNKLRVYGYKISSLPREIGELLSLTFIDLNCPHLEKLPETFAALKNLKIFNSQGCEFDSIPDFICGWIKLEYLGINMMDDFFKSSNSKMKRIPKNICNLKKLKTLDLHGTSIDKIPDSLGNCPLENLALTGDFKSIPESFGKLDKLKLCELYSNKPFSLPDSIGYLCALKKMSISAPAIKLPSSFGRLVSLEELNIRTGKDFSFPKNFGGLSSLKDIYINAEKMQKLPNSIGECKNIKILNVESDKLTILPDSFCKLKYLEELHLDTFALKKLPDNIGKLSALKYFYIVSGALTAFPESIGNLKELKYLSIDTYNVKKLPLSFNKLSYLKRSSVCIGKEEPAFMMNIHSKPSGNNKKRKIDFNEFISMGHTYRWKLLESYSVKQIESLLKAAPRFNESSNEGKEVVRDFMMIRSRKLNKIFKWTDENIKQTVKTGGAFIKAWEDSFNKVKKMLEALEQTKEKYHVEIILRPEILSDETDDIELYSTMTNYLKAEYEMSICLNFDSNNKEESLKKMEEDFNNDLNIRNELSWNIEGFGDIELKDHYICYALHTLYSHNNWAKGDIIKINNILAEIRITGGL